MNYERAIINFDYKCSLSCPFCYVPFQNKPIDFECLQRVVERCKEIGIRIITFSGGDPFDHPKFREILIQAHKIGFEIHIDTNAARLIESDFELIAKTTSLISLPIDGPNHLIHDQIRKKEGHFNLVMEHLQNLIDLDLKIKINTVVIKKNIVYIADIMDILIGLDISIWSVYQFMALSGSFKHADSYSVSDTEYENLMVELLSKPHPFYLETGKSTERRESYLFITPNGQVYTHNPVVTKDYLFLGSILQSDWQEAFWQLNRSTIREESKHRYFSLN